MVSQLLIAYTIEVDNLLEVRMAKAGYPEYGLSLVAYLNLLQYVSKDGVAVHEVMDRTFATQAQVAQIAGTLERWFILEVDTGKHRGEGRPGWLTSKGITATSILRPMPQGRVAVKAWSSIISTVEKRWASRFGESLPRLRTSLAEVGASTGVDMPDGVPSGWLRGDWRQFPPGSVEVSACLPIGVLLSKALLALTIDFERQSEHPIALCANTVRVLTPEGMPLSEVAVRSGLPAQMSSVLCTEAKNSGVATIKADPKSKIGKKVIALTAAGKRAQSNYEELARGVEKALGRKGKALRTVVEEVSSASDGQALRIAEGLKPPPRTTRAGAERPSLGMRTEMTRRAGGEVHIFESAQSARNKEYLAQTEAFMSDPRGTLPHYPVWDQNRGFGP